MVDCMIPESLKTIGIVTILVIGLSTVIIISGLGLMPPESNQPMFWAGLILLISIALFGVSKISDI